MNDLQELEKVRNGIKFFSVGKSAKLIAEKSYLDKRELYVSSGFFDKDIDGSLTDKKMAILMLKLEWENRLKKAIESGELEQFNSWFEIFTPVHYVDDGWIREDSLNQWLEDHVRNGIQITSNKDIQTKNEIQITSNSDTQTTTHKHNWKNARKGQRTLGKFLCSAIEKYHDCNELNLPTNIDVLRVWLLENKEKNSDLIKVVSGHEVKINSEGIHIDNLMDFADTTKLSSFEIFDMPTVIRSFEKIKTKL